MEYPKHINTVQDIENLLKSEHHERAIEFLRSVVEQDDVYTTRVVSTDKDGNDVTERISTPLPRWKQLGFKSRDDAKSLLGGK